MRAAALVLGILLTLWALLAMLRSMLIPHGSVGVVPRVVHGAVRGVAHISLRALPSFSAQDRFLSGVAPVSIVVQLVVFATILILTLGLVVFGLSDLTIPQSLYQSGATFTTLGIVEPVNGPGAVTTFVAAFLGLVVIAVFIGFLMAIYTTYASRESQMARVSMVAGEPAWGPQILVRGALLGLPTSELPDAKSWIDWSTSLWQNQRANHAFGDFRSTSPWRHWTTSLLAVLDAASLRLALDPTSVDPHLVELITEATESLEAISRERDREPRIPNWTIQSRVIDALAGGKVVDSQDLYVTRAEFDDALAELAESGVSIKVGDDDAWSRFTALRGIYIAYVVELAQAHHAVRAPWSGPRRPDVPVVWPVRAGREPRQS